jgi:hypothetical protein
MRIWHLMLLKAISVMLAVNAAIIWPMNLEAAQTQPPDTRSSGLFC